MRDQRLLDVLGCSSNETSIFSDWIVLPAETVSNSWSPPKKLEPFWDPPANLVADAMQQLPVFLQMAQTNGNTGYTNELRSIQERLSNTGCQFVGVTMEKQRGILLNCFPLKDTFSDGWKTHFIKVYDGGPGWWSVVYLPDENKFTGLSVNLGF